MPSNRFSLAYFLTLALIVFVFAGEQLALAQGPGECDTPIVQPAPRSAPRPVLRPAPPPAPRLAPPVAPRPAPRPTPTSTFRPDTTRLAPTPRNIFQKEPQIIPIPYPRPDILPGLGEKAGASVPKTSSTKPPKPEVVRGEQKATTYQVSSAVYSYYASALKGRGETTLKKLSASGRSISIIKFKGATPPTYFSNNIYIHDSNAVTRQDRERLAEVNKSFIGSLGATLLSDPSLRDARFMITAKSGSNEFVTIYESRGSKFGAITLNLKSPAAMCRINGCTMADVLGDIIDPWLRPISGRGRLYIIGDDLDRLDPTNLASRFSLDVIRRPDRISKSIKQTELSLDQLQDRKLERAQTIYVNGLPRNEAEVVQSGYQQNEVKKFQKAVKEMDKLAKKFFKQQVVTPTSPQSLEELLTRSESDVIFIVAHADKQRIYINGTPISIEEVKKYPARLTPNARPRVGILLSCYGGNFKIQTGWLFKQNIDSLAEVLIRKGYFDKVVAPRGEITLEQAQDILKDYLRGKPFWKIAAEHYQQLLQIAENGTRMPQSDL